MSAQDHEIRMYCLSLVWDSNRSLRDNLAVARAIEQYVKYGDGPVLTTKEEESDRS